MSPYPETAGQFLAHLEACGVADEWVVSTDPSDPRDECQSLRRTFRLKTLGDEEAAIMSEFGALFIVLADFNCLLSDLWRPLPLSELLESKGWATPGMRSFVAALERLFPRG